MNRLNYDVLIVGGGTAGCAAAYNCARLGLKTLLVEKNNFLGGLMTGGLVVPVMKSSVDDINNDYYKKLVKTAKKYEAQITYCENSNINDGWFNPEVLKIVLDEVLDFNNLDILFETNVCDVIIEKNVIKSVVLNSNVAGILSIPIDAKYYIDATGSAEFSKLCKCEFLSDNDLLQQSSLRFILGDVDIEKFCNFILEVDSDRNITNTYRDDINTKNQINFTTASTWDESVHWALDKYLKQGVADGILKDRDRAYFQLFSVAGSKRQVAFNCPRINNFKDKPFEASNELIEARRAIWRLYDFCRKYFPGFEEAVITNIATQTGIREENRIKTKYTYTKDDIVNRKVFNNPVLRADYSIDVHSDKKDDLILEKIPAYELPIEALMSADYDNLFGVGKIVGADFFAHSALRVQKSCMSMGEAVAKYVAGLR